jgi:ABC-type transport system involved in multi-copper enzyme maturation permease subunit
MPIFDQGYQHWKGPLAGHAWRWLAVARHGARTQLKSRIVRLVLLLAWLPALALVVALALWGLLEQKVASVLTFLGGILPQAVVAEPQEYRSAVWTVAYSYFFKAELICSIFLILVVAPNLISRDLRFNALPLYFSRPLRRFDYFVGKLAVIAFFLAATVVVPALTAYVLGVVFSLDLRVVRDTYRLLWASVLYGGVIIVSAGTLMLALSSLSRRTIYVGLAWAGLVFISMSISSILITIRSESTRRHVTYDLLAAWVEKNPPPPGITMVIDAPFPVVRNPAIWREPRRGDPKLSPEQEKQRRWLRAWSEAHSRCRAEAESIAIKEARDDWRPLCSYTTNLERLGEQLLDTDSAWVTFGRAIERPRAALGPLIGRRSRRLGGPSLDGPPDERVLADRFVWQFPWYWSAGVLAGLALVSVGVMTRQVKSLDRLK